MDIKFIKYLIIYLFFLLYNCEYSEKKIKTYKDKFNFQKKPNFKNINKIIVLSLFMLKRTMAQDIKQYGSIKSTNNLNSIINSQSNLLTNNHLGVLFQEGPQSQIGLEDNLILFLDANTGEKLNFQKYIIGTPNREIPCGILSGTENNSAIVVSNTNDNNQLNKIGIVKMNYETEDVYLNKLYQFDQTNLTCQNVVGNDTDIFIIGQKNLQNVHFTSINLKNGQVNYHISVLGNLVKKNSTNIGQAIALHWNKKNAFYGIIEKTNTDYKKHLFEISPHGDIIQAVSYIHLPNNKTYIKHELTEIITYSVGNKGYLCGIEQIGYSFNLFCKNAFDLYESICTTKILDTFEGNHLSPLIRPSLNYDKSTNHFLVTGGYSDGSGFAINITSPPHIFQCIPQDLNLKINGNKKEKHSINGAIFNSNFSILHLLDNLITTDNQSFTNIITGNNIDQILKFSDNCTEYVVSHKLFWDDVSENELFYEFDQSLLNSDDIFQSSWIKNGLKIESGEIQNQNYCSTENNNNLEENTNNNDDNKKDSRSCINAGDFCEVMKCTFTQDNCDDAEAIFWVILAASIVIFVFIVACICWNFKTWNFALNIKNFEIIQEKDEKDNQKFISGGEYIASEYPTGIV